MGVTGIGICYLASDTKRSAAVGQCAQLRGQRAKTNIDRCDRCPGMKFDGRSRTSFD